MAKTRVFIAVEASPEVRQRARRLVDRLAPHAKEARWVAEANLHYTLQFLGDITDQEIADVCHHAGRVAEEWSPFTLEARGVGAFPSIDRPRTLWIGAGRGGDELIALQQEVEAAMASLGFRGDHRPYTPHLTIGRARSASPGLTPVLQEHADEDAGATEVAELIVFASELHRDGPEYHVLSRSELGS